MSDVTRILQQIEGGDPSAAEQLLPMVYDELRKLAATRMANESPDHTLQATALVHEAYVRLVDAHQDRRWNSRGHFFGAAAEAMRRILIERARRQNAAKRRHRKQSLPTDDQIAAPEVSAALLALDRALDKLAASEGVVAELVKLRYFAGLSNRAAAECLGISPRTGNHYWAYAKAWLVREIERTT